MDLVLEEGKSVIVADLDLVLWPGRRLFEQQYHLRRAMREELWDVY